MGRLMALFPLLFLSLSSLEWGPVIRVPPEYGITYIDDMISDKSGEIWFVSGDILFSYWLWPNPRWSTLIPLTEGMSVEFDKDSRGNIWMWGIGRIGINTCVVAQFFNDNLQFSSLWKVFPDIPSGEWVATGDSSGGFWIGLVWGVGIGPGPIFINHFDGRCWTGAEQMLGESDYNWRLKMVTDKDGRVWVLWAGLTDKERWEGYARYYYNGEWSDTLFLKRIPSGRAFPDKRGGFWVIEGGYFSRYLKAHYFDGEKWSEESYEVDFLGKSTFTGIDKVPDRGKGVWVIRDEQPEEGGKNIWCIYFDFVKREWSEPEIVETCPDPEGWNNCPSATVDKEGRLWVAWKSERYGEEGVWMRYTLGACIETREKRYPLFSLSSSPNPSKRVTNIKYQVAEEGPVSLLIYDSQGRLVRTLIKEQNQKPGVYRIKWDVRDDRGRLLPKGVYFIRLDTQIRSLTEKVIVVR